MNQNAQKALGNFNRNLQRVPGLTPNPIDVNRDEGLAALAASVSELHDKVDRLAQEIAETKQLLQQHP